MPSQSALTVVSVAQDVPSGEYRTATLMVPLGGLLAAPSLTDGNLATNGLSYVLTSDLGDGMGRLLLADVAVASTACISSDTTGAR
jgi:hypothetical protein